MYLFHREMLNKSFKRAADNALPTDLVPSFRNAGVSYLPSVNKQSQAHGTDFATFVAGAFVHVPFLQVQHVPPVKQWPPLWDLQGFNVTLALLWP